MEDEFITLRPKVDCQRDSSLNDVTQFLEMFWTRSPKEAKEVLSSQNTWPPHYSCDVIFGRPKNCFRYYQDYYKNLFVCCNLLFWKHCSLKIWLWFLLGKMSQTLEPKKLLELLEKASTLVKRCQYFLWGRKKQLQSNII